MSWEVCKTADSGADCTDATEGSTVKNKWTATVTYQCINGDKHSGSNASNTDDMAAIAATGLKVNGSTYQSPDGEARPYMFCKSLSAKRDKKARHVFRVTAKFEEVVIGIGGDGGIACPEDLTDIDPKVTGSIIRSEEVLYEDYSNPAKQCYYMPVIAERYNAPVTSPQPNLRLVVEQYETSISFQDMMDRSFLVNSTAYRGRAAGHWQIQEVQARDAVVRLCDVTQPEGYVEVDCALVTYPILLSDYSVGNYAGTGNATKDEFVGHDTAMPLIASRYWDNNEGRLMDFADDESGIGNVGFVAEDGTKLGDQVDKPNYMIYKTTKRGPFDFLRA